MSDRTENNEQHQQTSEIPFPPKPPIQCILSAPQKHKPTPKPDLIFTHGVGGTLKSDAVVNFASGFASHSPILCFQGNMNLKSRIKMFSAVVGAQEAPRCLGGRSMGARAAVMAATEETTHLVLVSYPLHTDKEVRDQILLDLPGDLKVIFVSGDGDAMCDLERLEEVRARMKCETWRVVVQGADHGMNVKPKAGTMEVGKMVGEVVAKWVKGSDDSLREGTIIWNDEVGRAEWTGWTSSELGAANDEPVVPLQRSAKNTSTGTNKKKASDGRDSEEPKPKSKRSNKRRKI